MQQITPLIEVKNLNYSYLVKSQEFHVIRDVDFAIYPGETLGLVGESGCGKTTIGKLLMNLLSPSSGDIIFQGKSIRSMTKSEIKEMKKEVQIIFQDPYSSVNPRMSVEEIIQEPLIVHKIDKHKHKIPELLELVGLDSSYLKRYPHELSGGQRQRVVIARALAAGPKFLICDEPIAALDVSIQAQIITLFQNLQKELGLTYLFISHDLALVKYLANRMMVMYFGEVIEMGNSEELYKHPLHPYTAALFSPTQGSSIIRGEPPSPLEEVSGCPFASRCPKKTQLCTDLPPLKKLVKDRLFSCHHADISL